MGTLPVRGGGVGTALTAADAVTIDSTFDSTEQTTMVNMRTRINELETALKQTGYLA